MGTNTPNHGFGKPTPGGDTDVWGEILNEQTIDELEERVVITDDIANLGSYTPYEDAAFLGYDSTRDNVRVYLGDGSSWTAQSFGTEANPVPGTSFFGSVAWADQPTAYPDPQQGQMFVRYADSGSSIWSHSLHSDTVRSVFERDGVVYSGSYDNTVKAADAEDGTEIWSHSLHSDYVRTVFERDGVVYSGSDDNTVKAAVSVPASYVSLDGQSWTLHSRITTDREGGQLG